MRNYSVRFRTERFDYRGAVPEGANAGNQFYGRDVAEFLSSGLASRSLSTNFVDEDWGWLVLGKTQDNRFVEIAIYNLSPDGVPGQNGTNEWGLWVRAFQKKKQFFLLSRTHEIELPAEIANALQHLLQSADLAPTAWQHP